MGATGKKAWVDGAALMACRARWRTRCLAAQRQGPRAVARERGLIAELYDDRTGNLVIAATKNGPQIDIAIQGDGNLGGIDMMKIFCFDSMLFEAISDRLGGPRFFVHDSHLFDGVDARQVHAAILFGARTANAHSGQYVIAMNSDELEASGAASEPTVVESILPVRLTDDEHGGLFGFRFD